MPTILPRRSSLVLPLVLLVLCVSGLGAARAQESQQTAGDAIVARALEDVGTWGGQCWPWVREVVADAIGQQMGFGYHTGFIEGGAWEVPLSEARPGDIIQMADPTNNGPGVNYIGLHTAIVYKVHGGGVYTVLDSNSQFNEMVRVRENYNPAVMAARYNHISARVYRFGEPGGEHDADTPQPEAPAIEAGDQARVNTPGQSLNVRAGAGTNHGIVGRLDHGEVIRIESEPEHAGSYFWVRIEASDGRAGWVATDFLEIEESSVPGSSDPESGGPEDTLDPGDDDEAVEPGPDREGFDYGGVTPGLARE